MYNPKQVLLASRPFAHEQRGRSWWHLGTTIAALTTVQLINCSPLPCFVRLPFSVIAGLLIVRFFILFHDYQHGTILKGSMLAQLIMFLYGLFSLNPPSVWRRSHDHHHRQNSRNFGPNVGSYPLLTVESYEESTRWEQFNYRVSRHPLTMLFGYLTVFLWGMCLAPFMANPRRHWDVLLALFVHGGMLWMLSGNISNLILVGVIPFALSMALGAYLFYAQHNVPNIRLQTDSRWNVVFAAQHSSSYIEMSPIMHWFTGNIGYHHVHHLNAKIPFYRLPEAMDEIAGFRSTARTTLHPRDIWACLQLKLWDPRTQRLVHWPVAEQMEPTILKLPVEPALTEHIQVRKAA